jgi:hypothetical protein
MRYVRMVSPLFVGASLVVFCGFAMMMGRMLVVLGGCWAPLCAMTFLSNKFAWRWWNPAHVYKFLYQRAK